MIAAQAVAFNKDKILIGAFSGHCEKLREPSLTALIHGRLHVSKRKITLIKLQNIPTRLPSHLHLLTRGQGSKLADIGDNTDAPTGHGNNVTAECGKVHT